MRRGPGVATRGAGGSGGGAAGAPCARPPSPLPLAEGVGGGRVRCGGRRPAPAAAMGWDSDGAAAAALASALGEECAAALGALAGAAAAVAADLEEGEVLPDEAGGVASPGTRCANATVAIDGMVRDVLSIAWPLSTVDLKVASGSTVRDLLRTLLVAAALFAFLLLLVGWGRTGPLHRTFDSVWWQLSEGGTHQGVARTPLGVRLPRLGGWMSFLRAAVARSDDALAVTCSLDDVMLLRWVRMCAQFFTVLSVVSLPALLPLYARSLGSSGADGSTPLRELTIGNLATDTNWRWLPVVLIWAYTWFLIKMLSSLTAQYARLRWTVSPERAGVQMHAVLVSDVPTHSEDVAAALALASDPAQLAEVGSNVSATCSSCMAIVVWFLLDLMPGRLVLKHVVVPLCKRLGVRAIDYHQIGRYTTVQRGAERMISQLATPVRKTRRRARTHVRTGSEDLVLEESGSGLASHLTSGHHRRVASSLDFANLPSAAAKAAHAGMSPVRTPRVARAPPPALAIPSGDQLLSPPSIASVASFASVASVTSDGDGDSSQSGSAKRRREAIRGFEAETGRVAVDLFLNPDLGLVSREEVSKRVRSKFAESFSEEEVIHVIQALDTSEIDVLSAQLDAAREAVAAHKLRHDLTSKSALAFSRLGQRLKASLKAFMALQPTVPRLEVIDEHSPSTTATAKLLALESRASTLSQELREKRRKLVMDGAPSPSAIVIFKRRRTATIAGSVLLSPEFGTWNAEPAPGPTDVVWSNLHMTSAERDLKTLRVRLLAAFIILFAQVPVAYIKGLLVDNQDVVVHHLGDVAFELLVALVFVIFLVVGHVLSLALSRATGHKSFSRMDTEGAQIYFWLLALNVVVANMTTKSIWNELVDWTSDLGLLGLKLTSALVDTSQLFINFVAFRVAQSLPFELLHPPSHLRYGIKLLLHTLSRQKFSESARRAASVPEYMPAHRVPAQMGMIVLLGTLYSVFAPLILPVCAVYFWCALVFWKHNCVYHYRSRYTNGGELWPFLQNMTLRCLLLMQLITFGGMGAADNALLRLFLLPLPFYTYYAGSALHRRTMDTGQRMPLFADADAVAAASLGALQRRIISGGWREYIPRNLRGMSGTRLFKEAVVRIIEARAFAAARGRPPPRRAEEMGGLSPPARERRLGRERTWRLEEELLQHTAVSPPGARSGTSPLAPPPWERGPPTRPAGRRSSTLGGEADEEEKVSANGVALRLRVGTDDVLLDASMPRARELFGVPELGPPMSEQTLMPRVGSGTDAAAADGRAPGGSDCGDEERGSDTGGSEAGSVIVHSDADGDGEDEDDEEEGAAGAGYDGLGGGSGLRSPPREWRGP